METETTTWSELKESHCRIAEQILASEERKKEQECALITVWDMSRKINHLSKVIWDRKIIKEFTRIGYPVLMTDFKISKDKHISRWVDWESLIYVRWNRIKNLCIKMKKMINREKTGKTLDEVKPVKNISKNLQSFVEVSPVQNEVLLSHKLQDHAYE